MTSTSRMSGYVYSQYNDSYDTASERNSQIFWDALSMTSGSDRNSIALSIYHSVPELHEGESSRYHVVNGSSAMDKVCGDILRSNENLTYFTSRSRIGKTITTKKMAQLAIDYRTLFFLTIKITTE